MPSEAGALDKLRRDVRRASYWELAVEMCGPRALLVGLFNRLLDEILLLSLDIE
jgi:hypothetical protein